MISPVFLSLQSTSTTRYPLPGRKAYVVPSQVATKVEVWVFPHFVEDRFGVVWPFIGVPSRFFAPCGDKLSTRRGMTHGDQYCQLAILNSSCLNFKLESGMCDSFVNSCEWMTLTISEPFFNTFPGSVWLWETCHFPVGNLSAFIFWQVLSDWIKRLPLV